MKVSTGDAFNNAKLCRSLCLNIFVYVFVCVACKVFIMMTFLVVSTAVFLCPLAICSPCITNILPPKPALVGHRGAPMVSVNALVVTFILRHSFLLLKHVYAGVTITILSLLFIHVVAELHEDFHIILLE